jgi:hypothetical protein
VKGLVASMLNRLKSYTCEELIPWAAPIPCFGNIQKATTATLGINPSNREFVNENGHELVGNQRRFHTLKSLELQNWSQAGAGDIDQILESCSEYFFRNPYSTWFNRLNPIVAATGRSYYDRLFPACHIDLLPFATDSKWGSLSLTRRRQILRDNSDLLLEVIQASSLKLIILNGQSVVSEFMAVTRVSLEAEEMPNWALPRASGDHVVGVAYSGVCEKIDGRTLARPLKVLGFNHNIQSSFGVTGEAVRNIAQWVNAQDQEIEYA